MYGILLILVTLAPNNLALQDDIGHFWHISDLHYDFTYNTDGASCNPEVPRKERGIFGHHWCDSSWRLIESAVLAMNAHKPNADFIIWTGDNNYHQRRGSALTKNASLAHLQIITDHVSATMPNTPLYPAFGNNDILPKSQWPARDNYVTVATWEMWNKSILADQKDTFIRGGFYRKDIMKTNLSLIVLNTNLYLYYNPLSGTVDDPAGQFAWMESQLIDIRREGRAAMLVAHVGPGVFPKYRFLWMYPKYHERFLNILQSFADIIRAVNVGHDHLDRFRVLFDTDNQPLVPIYFALSVSPWRYKKGNSSQPNRNPGIRLVTYNRQTGEMLDIEQLYLDLDLANCRQISKWDTLYKMREIFWIDDLTARSVSSLVTRMKSEPSLLDLVLKINLARMDYKPTCDKICRAEHYCSLWNLRLGDHDRCVKDRLTSGAERHPRPSIVAGVTVLLMLQKLVKPV